MQSCMTMDDDRSRHVLQTTCQPVAGSRLVARELGEASVPGAGRLPCAPVTADRTGNAATSSDSRVACGTCLPRPRPPGMRARSLGISPGNRAFPGGV